MQVRFSAAIAAALALAVSASQAASAAPDGTTVSGTIKLPKLEDRPAPPVRNRGFFDRMPNPVRPPAKRNPLPELVIVLEGGDPHPDDQKPPGRPVEYQVIGESFAVPILPVVAGSRIELVNQGKRSPRLHCPAFPKLLDGDPINPNGERDFNEPVAEPFEVIEIRDKDSAHLRGRILPLPHAYFARVDSAGKFEIAGVPAGTWSVRVWYHGGWLTLPETPKVEVKGRSSSVSIELPAELKVAGPGKEG